MSKVTMSESALDLTDSLFNDSFFYFLCFKTISTPQIVSMYWGFTAFFHLNLLMKLFDMYRNGGNIADGLHSQIS